jgi:hypothetical protein
MYQEEKRDLENAIIERAWKDEDFRGALTGGDAKSAISEAFGRQLPFDVNVVSDTNNTINIVLPNFDPTLDVELTDDQLEAVAGGGDCWWTCAVTNCEQTGCGHTNSAPVID